MRSTAKKQAKLNLQTIEFIVVPKSITFQKIPNHASQSYFIDVDKGPQFIKRFDEDIVISSANQFVFWANQSVTITIHNPKTANYAFTLYLQSQGTDTYKDTFPIDLILPYQIYRQELTQHADEYNAIVDNVANKVPIGCSWQSLKEHVKTHQQILESKNSSGSISIKFCVEIITPIDKYAESMLSKTKLQTTSSLGSKKSSSSKNSKRDTKQKQPTSSFLRQKTDKPTQSQVYNSSLVTNPEKWSCQSSPTAPIRQENLSATPQPRQLPTLYLPLQSVLHKVEHLSDIIQQSYQGSSNINSVERTDRKWKQLPEITEEADIVQRKTEKLLPQKGYEDQLRRGSSWDQNQRRLSHKEIQLSNQDSDYCLLKQKENSVKQNKIEKELQRKRISIKNQFIVLCFICVLWFVLSVVGVSQSQKLSGGSMFPKIKQQRIRKNKYSNAS